MEKEQINASNLYSSCLNAKIELANTLKNAAINRLDYADSLSSNRIEAAIVAAKLANDIISQLMELEE